MQLWGDSRDLTIATQLSGKSVDVILKSDDRMAVTTLDVLSTWFGEIEFKRLPVIDCDGPPEVAFDLGNDVICLPPKASPTVPTTWRFAPRSGLPVMLAMLLVAIGISVLRIGWRGRLVDIDPHCAECFYNLTNRPEGQQRCPECGAWITAHDAICYSMYETRWRVVWTGLLAMAAGMFWVVYFWR
jgi:hypothetical protein